MAVEEWTARCVCNVQPARVMGTDCSDTRWWWSYDKSRTHACVVVVTVGGWAWGWDDISGGLLRFKNLAITDS